MLVAVALLEGPQLILSTHANFSPVASWLQGLRGATVLVSAHGIEVWNLPEGHIRNALRRANKILPVSEYTRVRLAKELGLSAKRFEVVPDTYDSEKFQPGPVPLALRQRLGLEGKKVLYTLARLDPGERYKGIDEVLSILPELTREIPNLIYLIGGKGGDRERLEEKARTLGVAERVIFAGFVPEAEKADYYRLADLFVMPGWGEGFGIVYLESAACGVPVLGSTLDASQEVIRSAGLGEAVNPKNAEELRAAILRMLKNQPKGPFPGLEKFNRESFRRRVRDLLRGLG
jgi:glycosyltransferase involved in cell wall biosynthesis